MKVDDVILAVARNKPWPGFGKRKIFFNWKGRTTVKRFWTLVMVSALFSAGCTPPPAATVSIDSNDGPPSTTTDTWNTTTDAWNTTTDAWSTTTDAWDTPTDAWNTTTDAWGTTTDVDGFGDP